MPNFIFQEKKYKKNIWFLTFSYPIFLKRHATELKKDIYIPRFL